MGWPLRRIVLALPPRSQRLEKRQRGRTQDIATLRELRQLAGKVQAEVATALRIKQPSVSKIERQTDMYLSTLRAYVEAIDGELELVVRLAKQPVLRLYRLSDVFGHASRSPRQSAGRRTSVRPRSASPSR